MQQERRNETTTKNISHRNCNCMSNGHTRLTLLPALMGHLLIFVIFVRSASSTFISLLHCKAKENQQYNSNQKESNSESSTDPSTICIYLAIFIWLLKIDLILHWIVPTLSTFTNTECRVQIIKIRIRATSTVWWIICRWCFVSVKI